MSLHIHSKFPNPVGAIHLTENSAVYLNNSLRSLGLAIVGIFIPIYLFNLNLPFVFVSNRLLNSLLIVLIFYFLESFFTVLCTLLFSNVLFRHIKFKYLVLYSNILLSILLFAIGYIETFPFLLFVLPAFFGLYILIYWIPYHLFFVEKTVKSSKLYGKKVGISTFIANSFTAFGPLIGGFSIAVYGYNATFILSCFIIIISVFPILFEMREHSHKISSSFVIVKDYLFNKKFAYLNLAFTGVIFEAISFTIFWPVLLIIILNDFEKLGVLSFITILVSSFIALFAGKLVDSSKGKIIHLIGVLFTSLFHFLRVFVTIPFGLYSIDLLDRSVGNIYSLPFNAKIYSIASKNAHADFLVYREIVIHLARMFGLVVASIILLSFDNWRFVFLLGVIGPLLSFLVNKTSKRKIFSF